MRKKNTIKTSVISDDMQVGYKYIKIFVILLLIFGTFSLITYFVTKEKKTSDSEATIQYSKIIVGSILNASSSPYYVLVEYENDKLVPLYEAYLSNAKSSDANNLYYVVDLTDGFNSLYVADTPNLSVTETDKFRFSETTLLKIVDNKVASSYVTKDKIVEQLKTI